MTEPGGAFDPQYSYADRVPIVLPPDTALSDYIDEVTAPDLALKIDATAAALSANGVIATGSPTTRLLGDVLGELVNVKSEGAVGNGVTDDTAAFLSALAKSSEIYLPPGDYVVSQELPLMSGLRIRGAKDKSRILWQDTANLFRRNALASRITDVEFKDFSVIGKWASNQSNGSYYPFLIYNVDGLTFDNVGVDYSRLMSIAVRSCTEVAVRNCRIRWSARDGISVGTSSRVLIIGNTIDHCDDDAIACHSQSDEGPLARSGIVIVGNRISDSQGIKAIGGKHIVITGNQLSRIREGGISVAYTNVGTEGKTAVIGVMVSDNVITDVINRNGIDGLNNSLNYISIGSMPAQAGGLAAAPGRNDTATGTVISPYEYFAVNGASVPQPGGWFITVTDNTCARTLPTGVDYSTYGFGLMFTRNGWLDPAMTTAELSSGRGVNIGHSSGGTVRNALISGNIINGVKAGFYFQTGEYRSVRVAGNIVSDFSDYGVVFAGTGAQDVEIDANMFNGDPFLTHASRSTNGTWTNVATPAAIAVGTVLGAKVTGNTVKNVVRVVDGSGAKYEHGNFVHGQPAGVGYNASSKGVGTVPRGGLGWTCIPEDSDPTSATFGQVLSVPAVEGTAMPTTGLYVTGHFVKNSAPAIASGKVLRGWHRLLTSSAHVLDTTWAADYGSTS